MTLTHPPLAPPAGDPDALDAALRDAVREVARLHTSPAHEFAAADRVPGTGGSSGGSSGSPRIATSRERRWSDAHDVARSAVDRAVTAYTRGARDAGTRIADVLDSVSVAVRAAAPQMALGARDALVRDTGRWCVRAYYTT